MVWRSPQHAVSILLVLRSLLSDGSSSRSPVHHFASHPPDRFPSENFHVKIRDVHRSSRILPMFPAQVHVLLLTCSISNSTFVFSLTKTFVFLSRHDMFNILLLSIFACAAGSLFIAWLVNIHVSTPYIIAGRLEVRKCVVELSCQIGSFVTIEAWPVVNSSLNILVFIFVFGAVSLSQVDVAFSVLSL